MSADVGVIMLIGLPGSGKSTLAHALAHARGYTHIDRDRIRAAMFPVCRFTEAEKHAANTAVHAAIDAALALGDSVIVDGMTFSRRAERDAVRALAAARGAWTQGVFLDAPVALATARIRDTAHPAADRDEALVAAVAARFEQPDEPDVLHMDAAVGVDDLLSCVLAALADRA